MAACGGPTASGDLLLSYEHVRPDGIVESQTVWSDRRIEMRHGEHLERFRIPQENIQRLEEALSLPIPTGSPDGSSRRKLTLADGTTIEAPQPDPGTATELLERLLDRHAF